MNDKMCEILVRIGLVGFIGSNDVTILADCSIGEEAKL